jgi:hypothetical protein
VESLPGAHWPFPRRKPPLIATGGRRTRQSRMRLPAGLRTGTACSASPIARHQPQYWAQSHHRASRCRHLQEQASRELRVPPELKLQWAKRESHQTGMPAPVRDPPARVCSGLVGERAQNSVARSPKPNRRARLKAGGVQTVSLEDNGAAGGNFDPCVSFVV